MDCLRALLCLTEHLNKPCIALSCECRDCIATHAGNWIRMPSLFFKRARVVNPPYVVTCLSSKPVCPSHGLVMFHNIGTAAPFRATMQKQGVEPSPYQIRNKDYHIVKERSALSLGTTVRFVWYRLNPRRESEPEALYYVVLLG